MSDTPTNNTLDLAEDLLEGADAIAEFLYNSKTYRRKIYYLAERCRIPIFRMGAMLCARKSVLMRFITDQENRAWATDEAIDVNSAG